MLCLELGANLAALTAEHCRPYPNVEVQNIAFEEWPLHRKAFDLVISAEAFHWIPPDFGYARVASALKDEGALAVFWHHSLGEDTPFRRAIENVYQEQAPHLVGHLPGKTQSIDLIKTTVAHFDSSGQFGPVVVKQYPCPQEYTTGQYIKLVSTHSPIRSLPQETRQSLLAGVREVVEQFGGTVESRGMVVLYVAQVQR
jgi:hypothetical protein